MYDLRDRLRARNSNLLIRFGKMEEVAVNLVQNLQANGDEVKGVFMQKEVGYASGSRAVSVHY